MIRRVGEVRPSQVMHTFGIGSVVDLPYFSVVILGLHRWGDPRPEQVLSEDRLLRLVRSHLPQVEKLVTPPARTDATKNFDPFDAENLKGIPVSPFPRWVRCPLCNLMAPLISGVFELKANPYHPDNTKYVHQGCPKARGSTGATVVPVRFIRICEESGHMDDFPWVEYVHQGQECGRPLLRLFEFGASAEAADIVVKCDTCDVSRPMAPAFKNDGLKHMGGCTGYHPHINHRDASCKADQMRAVLTGATNFWFPVNVSVLTVPTGKGRLAQLIKDKWSILCDIGSFEVLKFARKQVGELDAFAEWTDEELWASVEQERKQKGEDDDNLGISDLKSEEWEIFARPDSVLPDSTLLMEKVPPPNAYGALIENVVLLTRLRVVNALIGFTRLISPGDFADINEIPDIRVRLSRSNATWVPAGEVKGEGIFIKLKEDAVRDWLSRESVHRLEATYQTAHENFRRARKVENPAANFPGIRYILLHSLSHALIRQLAVECGYGAASIRERIYASDGSRGDPMAGILLYTAAPDSEGTLGGLVALGHPDCLCRHLDQALAAMKLCASDPLCAEQNPTDANLTLHGASCHACLFSSETSCERSNKYLDRSVLIETVLGAATAFFTDPGV